MTHSSARVPFSTERAVGDGQPFAPDLRMAHNSARVPFSTDELVGDGVLIRQCRDVQSDLLQDAFHVMAATHHGSREAFLFSSTLPDVLSRTVSRSGSRQKALLIQLPVRVTGHARR